jgi:5'-3' exonuclease
MTMPQAKTIALVDVGCLFKRTFEANPNAGGQNTLAEIVRIEERVEHVVLCLDSPPYAKKEIFPEYKAQRPEPETSEVFQKRWLYEELKRRGYPMARVKGQEADDVIATLARIYGESWAEVWLVGADKDLAQCVTDNVLQLVPKHGDRAEHFRGPADVKEKFEVTPKQIPLFLALWGDKSDNVPGVPGIGPVKAAGLIAEHKTLTGIAEHLAAGSGKVWEALRANWEQLVLSLKLTTLDTKLPLDAEGLLVRAETKVAETMAPQVELEFDGFMGNATPMPEPMPEQTRSGSGTHAPVAAPEPIIGKDPRADEFLRQEAAARAEHAEEQKREEQWRQQRRAEQQQASEAQAAPKSAPAPKVTEAEFIPFGQPGPVPAPKPQPAAWPRPRPSTAWSRASSSPKTSGARRSSPSGSTPAASTRRSSRRRPPSSPSSCTARRSASP